MAQGEVISKCKTFGEIRLTALPHRGTSLFESITNQRREGREERGKKMPEQISVLRSP